MWLTITCLIWTQSLQLQDGLDVWGNLLKNLSRSRAFGVASVWGLQGDLGVEYEHLIGYIVHLVNTAIKNRYSRTFGIVCTWHEYCYCLTRKFSRIEIHTFRKEGLQVLVMSYANFMLCVLLLSGSWEFLDVKHPWSASSVSVILYIVDVVCGWLPISAL